MHRRRLQFELPPPTASHPRTCRWRRPQPQQPRLLVLVPSSRGDSPTRLPHRPEQPHPAKTIPPTCPIQQRPTHLTGDAISAGHSTHHRFVVAPMLGFMTFRARCPGVHTCSAFRIQGRLWPCAMSAQRAVPLSIVLVATVMACACLRACRPPSSVQWPSLFHGVGRTAGNLLGVVIRAVAVALGLTPLRHLETRTARVVTVVLATIPAALDGPPQSVGGAGPLRRDAGAPVGSPLSSHRWSPACRSR